MIIEKYNNHVQEIEIIILGAFCVMLIGHAFLHYIQGDALVNAVKGLHLQEQRQLDKVRLATFRF
mgnify:FL=1